MKRKIIVIFALFLFFANFSTECALSEEISQGDLQRYSAYYSNGMQYLKNQQFSSAINEFRKVLRFSPYDAIIQASLANAYYSRAQYLRQTTKEVKKALVDYKSAAFYAKYWSDNPNQNLLVLANNAQNDINNLEKKLTPALTNQDRFKEAKILRAQGELAASAYDFQQLKSTGLKNEAYENLGNIYKNLNNLKYAMDYFKTAIDNNPKNAKLHFMYGVMLDEAKNYEASMEQYNLALQYGDKSPELLEILENKWTQNIVNNPNDAQSYINLGAIYQKQGDFERAKSQYLKAHSLDSSDDTALYNLASLYIEQKNYPNAIGVYDKLLSKNPKNTEVLNYKAQAYKAQGNYSLALKQYETILENNPNDSTAKTNIDDIVYNHLSADSLKNYIAQKAQTNPNSYEAQFNYALELHKNKDYNNAIAYYKKAQSLNPSKEETYINLSQIYLEQKDYKNAIQICQKGLMVLPNSADLKKSLSEIEQYNLSKQYDLALKYYNEGKYSQALSEYQNIKVKTREVKMAMASCYWLLGDFKNANKYYLDVLLTNPNDIEALTNSAFAYLELKDTQNAKASANKILAIDKNNADAKKLLFDLNESETSALLQDAISKYEKKDYTTAIALLNKLLTQKPNDEFALYYKGLCFDEQNKRSEAIKIYKQLILKNPSFESAYYSLAVDLDNLENYKEAITNYEKFIQLKNNNKSDEMVNFSINRVKELKNYLDSIKNEPAKK